MDLNAWMARYKDRKLGQMILPGSHDAGTAKNYIDLTMAGTNSNSATQQLTITQQLQIGTRFFDLRLKTHDNKVVAHHTTGGQGAYSQIPVNRVLENAALWCSMYKSEVVVLRISHTSESTNVHEIIKRSCKGVLHTGQGNLATKSLAEITKEGGGLICILDSGAFGSVIKQSEGIHAYSKYKGSNISNGIMTCGCYSGTHKLDQVICNGLKGQYEHNEKHSKDHAHLWQVYWQKTYINPMSTTGIEDGTKKSAYYHTGDKKVHGGTQAATAHMLKLMQGLGRIRDEDYAVAETKGKGLFKKKKKLMYSTLDFRQYNLPNIFSYDFVNEATNRQIIEMNEKNLQAFQDDLT